MPHATLGFNRNAYHTSPRGTRVYYTLTYLPAVNCRYDYLPTGSYEIEKLSPTTWVVIHKQGSWKEDGNAGGPTTTRRVGSAKTLTAAKKIAQDDYTKQWEKIA